MVDFTTHVKNIPTLCVKTLKLLLINMFRLSDATLNKSVYII